MEQGGGSPWEEGGNGLLDAEFEGTVSTLIRTLMYEVLVVAPTWPAAPCLSRRVPCSSSPANTDGWKGNLWPGFHCSRIAFPPGLSSVP